MKTSLIILAFLVLVAVQDTFAIVGVPPCVLRGTCTTKKEIRKVRKDGFTYF